MKALSFLLAFGLTASLAQAATISFDLIGTGGPGLLFTNEPGVTSGGSGGEIGAGIWFDDVSKQLTINVGWGSKNGFTDLTGPATNAHIHGPTASINGSGFTETAGVFLGLTGSPFTYTNGAADGTIMGTSGPLTAAGEAALMDGKLYINVHTDRNRNGEIRGFLTANPNRSVPETGSSLGMLGLALGVVGLATRKQRKSQ